MGFVQPYPFDPLARRAGRATSRAGPIFCNILPQMPASLKAEPARPSSRPGSTRCAYRAAASRVPALQVTIPRVKGVSPQTRRDLSTPGVGARPLARCKGLPPQLPPPAQALRLRAAGSPAKPVAAFPPPTSPRNRRVVPKNQGRRDHDRRQESLILITDFIESAAASLRPTMDTHNQPEPFLFGNGRCSVVFDGRTFLGLSGGQVAWQIVD